VAGLLAAVCMGCLVLCRYKGIRPSFLFYTVITVFFMLHAVNQCRLWSSEPELQRYFFQLLACVLLMLTAYQHCVMTVRKGSRQWFVFSSQASLFFCCLSANTGGVVFYLCMAAWLALDLCSLHITHRQASAPEEA